MDTTHTTLPEVAKKRGIQTLLTGLAVDIAVAMALVVTTVVIPAMNTWQDVVTSWPVWLLAFSRSAIQAVASWALRRFADHSGFTEPQHPVADER